MFVRRLLSEKPGQILVLVCPLCIPSCTAHALPIVGDDGGVVVVVVVCWQHVSEQHLTAQSAAAVWTSAGPGCSWWNFSSGWSSSVATLRPVTCVCGVV